jgi:hypothetical protein
MYVDLTKLRVGHGTDLEVSGSHQSHQDAVSLGVIAEKEHPQRSLKVFSRLTESTTQRAIAKKSNYARKLTALEILNL